MLSPMQEILFWTGIMRDHGEFMLSSFSYNEREPIQYARYYRDAFAGLNERAGRISEAGDAALSRLIDDCRILLAGLINFKRSMLARILECRLDSSLPPTFYNHMINEALDFCKTLAAIKTGAVTNPVFENLSLHKLWLTDAAGHAAAIAADLDPVEKCLVKEAAEFEKCFLDLAKKADELCSMLTRACLFDGALRYLNEEVVCKMTEFICYLEKIRLLRVNCMALGTLKPLIPDHMIREEKYYLEEIAGTIH